MQKIIDGCMDVDHIPDSWGSCDIIHQLPRWAAGAGLGLACAIGYGGKRRLGLVIRSGHFGPPKLLCAVPVLAVTTLNGSHPVVSRRYNLGQPLSVPYHW